MKSPADQREHVRYEVQWEVEISASSWEDVLTVTTTSVSRGGVFVKSNSPAEQGATVKVSIHLPDESTVKLEGDVVRTVKPGTPGQSPGFAIKFDPSRSSDLVLLESMAAAFGSPDNGDPAQRSSIKASVITRQVSHEESALEISSEAAPPPAKEEAPVAEHRDGADSSEFASQPTVQRQPSPEEIQKVAGREDRDQPATATREPADSLEVPVTVELDAEPATDRPEVFAEQPTANVDGTAPDADEVSGSYDVGEQIRQAMGGEIHETPLAPEKQAGADDEAWPGEGTPGASEDKQAAGAASLPPLVEDGDATSRPTVEAPRADSSRATVEAPASVSKKPTRETPRVKKQTREAPAVQAQQSGAPSPPEPRRATLPPIEQRGDGDEALAFGIDFGTSYSSIGLFYEGQVAVLEDDEGHPLVPTAVSYPEQGAPEVGWAAREQMATHPSTTFTSPKRLIGRSYDDQNLLPLLSSSAVHYDRGPGDQIVADVYGQPTTMIQVAAEVFRHLCSIGDKRAGRQVRKVALAAPVAFEEAQRSAITRAARMSGLDVVAFIDEPVAAAIGYGASGDKEQLIAVYDFGGGTFDFTLLRAGGGNFDVLGEAGDAWLGGDDFDLALANYVADQFFQQKKVDLRRRQVEWQRLIFLCERAKRQLTREEETVVEGKGMALSIKGAIDLKVGINRELFGDLCRDLVERSIDTMETCFMLTGNEPHQVDQVVMTGGVSRIPMVRERVEAFFGRPIPLTVNPEEAIVIGTARFARQTAGIHRGG